jgi:hypothetical protein
MEESGKVRSNPSSCWVGGEPSHWNRALQDPLLHVTAQVTAPPEQGDRPQPPSESYPDLLSGVQGQPKLLVRPCLKNKQKKIEKVEVTFNRARFCDFL